MRISDWSSDVCSSDLETAIFLAEAEIVAHAQLFIGVKAADEPVELAVEGFALQAQFLREGVELAMGVGVGRAIEGVDRAIVAVTRLRSEERRGGKECVSTVRSRWSPDH